eukprot:6390797-Amphidinium_carterae.1
MCALDKLGLFLGNTFQAHADLITWFHASGAGAQLDYIGLSRTMLKRQMCVYTVNAVELATSITSDHQMVVGELLMPPAKSRPAAKKRALNKFLSQDHKLAFMLRLHLGEETISNSGDPPNVYYNKLMAFLQDALTEIALKGNRSPKQPWISSETNWSWMTDLSHVRKLKRAEHLWQRRLWIRAGFTWWAKNERTRLDHAIAVQSTRATYLLSLS